MPWLSYAAENSAPPAKQTGAPADRSGGAVSSHLTEAIRARLPAFKPAAPPAPTPTADAASSEVPVILEKVAVTEQKVPTVDEFHLLTKAGQAAYLQKRFPGAVVPGPDPLTENTPNYASQMLRDKRRQESLAKWGETVATLRATGDLAGSKSLREETQRALIRTYDWRDERLDRSYNNDRR